MVFKRTRYCLTKTTAQCYWCKGVRCSKHSTVLKYRVNPMTGKRGTYMRRSCKYCRPQFVFIEMRSRT